MTKLTDQAEFEVDWLDYGKYTPECKDCAYFKHTHCGNPEADHYCHMIVSEHPACLLFIDKMR